ncbi:MAG TPA: hypothetical protein VEA16_12325, partial [Vicinamibacterales bacterium]|nr:hypothetical protein [Vicinamibacterales bacterium]
LSPVERASILPDSVSFTDKAPYLFTARYDDFGHLISAFPISFFVRSEAAFQREARRRLAKHFPNGKKLEVRYLWRGLAWINQSLLPEVYDLGHGALAIQACNGRGISTNVALGAELVEALATERPDALSVKPRPPAPIRLHRLASLAPTALMSLAYLSR